MLTLLTLEVLNCIEFCLDVLEWTWRPFSAVILLLTFKWMMTKGYNTVGVTWVEVGMMFLSSFCVVKGAINQLLKYYRIMLKPKFSAKLGETK